MLHHQPQMATISSNYCKPTSSTPQICNFLSTRAVSPSDSLPPLPVLLCSLCGSGCQISPLSSQLNDADSWQQSTEKLRGAVNIPGALNNAIALSPGDIPTLGLMGGGQFPRAFHTGVLDLCKHGLHPLCSPWLFTGLGYLHPAIRLPTHKAEGWD